MAAYSFLVYKKTGTFSLSFKAPSEPQSCSNREELNREEVDLVAEKDKERIAIEIETGNSDAVKNAKECLKSGFEVVISVPVNREIEDQIKERLRREKLDRKERVLVINSEKFE